MVAPAAENLERARHILYRVQDMARARSLPSFRVVVADQVFPDVDVERELFEAAGGELIVADSRDEALELMRDADAVLTTYMQVDEQTIKTLSRAKIIARYGIGVDNVDLAAARAAGIRVSNVPDYCIEEVAAHTVALMLMLVRRIPQGQALVRSGRWGVGELGEVHRLSALTVGLVGCGRIGRRVASAIENLGGRVLIHDPYLAMADAEARLVGLDELFATADVVSIHCPLTPETRGLVGEVSLARMRDGSYLVNTSRGQIVDLEAVIAALRTGKLAGAALDVLDSEPPDFTAVNEVPNLVVTPHSAFLSVEAIRESQRKAAQQVLHAIRGEQLDYEVT
jgi:D-3-phosphoglycerate dehydrogenase